MYVSRNTQNIVSSWKEGYSVSIGFKATNLGQQGQGELTVAAVVGSGLASTSLCRRWQPSWGLAAEHRIPCCPLDPSLALVWEHWGGGGGGGEGKFIPFCLSRSQATSSNRLSYMSLVILDTGRHVETGLCRNTMKHSIFVLFLRSVITYTYRGR